jgi:hypothetical protein
VASKNRLIVPILIKGYLTGKMSPITLAGDARETRDSPVMV